MEESPKKGHFRLLQHINTICAFFYFFFVTTKTLLLLDNIESSESLCVKGVVGGEISENTPTENN